MKQRKTSTLNPFFRQLLNIDYQISNITLLHILIIGEGDCILICENLHIDLTDKPLILSYI